MAPIYLFFLFLIFYVLATTERTLDTNTCSQILYGGGRIDGIPSSYPAPAKPRMTFQYPYTSPWDFYQSPWLMYRQPEMLSREEYYRNLVPNYYR